MTVREALEAAVARLAGSASPRPEAEELIGRLMDLRRADLTLQAARPLSADQEGILSSWIERRLAGEPVQYITGRAAFRSLDLRVTPDVLVPRPETEGLVERALEVLREERRRWPSPRVLDLGTGSGAIAVAIASEWPSAAVTATDASPKALEVARGNAAAAGLAHRVRLLSGHWFRPLDTSERFEVVLSNPPYVAEAERHTLPRDVRDHEPSGALFSGPTGLEALREIVEGTPRHLAAGGLLGLEVAEARAPKVVTWLEDGGEWERVRLYEDLAGRPRVVLARRKTESRPSLGQWPG